LLGQTDTLILSRQKQVGRYEKEMHDFIARKYPAIYTDIATKKALTDEIKATLNGALKEFSLVFDPNKKFKRGN